MFIIGILIFCILMFVLMSFASGVSVFIDLPSLIVVFGLSMPVIMASGLWGDLMKGFKLMQANINPYSLIELKRIVIALRLTMKMLIISGVIGTFVGGLAVLRELEDIALLVPSLSVALLTTFYAFLFVVFLLPIEAKVRAIMTTLE